MSGRVYTLRQPTAVNESGRIWTGLTEKAASGGRLADVRNRRAVAHAMERQAKYLESLSRPEMESLFEGWKHYVGESTTASDITTFTTQQIAMIEPIFEALMVDRVATLGGMDGPTAFIHDETFKQGDAGTYYESGSPFDEGLDPDYADCPSECSASNSVDYAIGSTLVTASCKSLHAEFSAQAAQDAQSQYNRNMIDRLNYFMALEFRRELQQGVLNTMIANAGASVSWDANPAGVYTSLDPKIWQKTLFQDAMQELNAELMQGVDNKRPANVIFGSINDINRLQRLKEFAYQAVNPERDLGVIDEYPDKEGNAVRFSSTVVSFEHMTPNYIAMAVKDDARPIQMHLTYVPITSLGTHLDPKTACYTIGAMTRYANPTLRPDGIGLVEITPET